MKLLLTFILVCILALIMGIVLFDLSFEPKKTTPIKVGLLHAISGFRSSRESPVQQATLMAIEEINQSGGILGQKIVPIIKDTESNWETTQRELENLLANPEIAVVFGSWMPGNRTSFRRIIDKYKKPLFYPFQYEGLVKSPYLVSMGITANQQVTPTIDYCLNHFGKRLFLVGSNYIFPYLINTMVRDQVIAREGEIVGEMYIPLLSNQVDQVIEAIIKTQPDAIINSILSNDAPYFFKKLREAGVTADQIPNFSFNITETTLANAQNIEDMVGQYATWSYFQSINTPRNQKFVNDFKRFSHLNMVDSTSETAYISVCFWAQAARETETTDFQLINKALNDMRIKAPEGPVTMDINEHYTWKYVRIGKVLPNRQFEIIWQSQKPMRPIPYQLYRSNKDWERLIEIFFQNSPELNYG